MDWNLIKPPETKLDWSLIKPPEEEEKKLDWKTIKPPIEKPEITTPAIAPYSPESVAQQLKAGIYPTEEPKFSLKEYYKRLGKAGVKGFETGAFLGYTPVFEEFEPETVLEKATFYSSALGGFILPITAAAKVVGLGFGGAMRLVPALSKIPAGIRIVGLSTATGAILGAAEKPEVGETRLESAVKTGALFGVFAGVGLGAQKVLAKRGIARLNNILAKSDDLEKVLKETEISLTKGSKQIFSNPRIAAVLKGLKGGDKTIVLNIVKGKRGLPIELRKGWYEKHIGEPLYNKIVASLDKWKWGPVEWIKKNFVYRYGQPKEWANAAEKRLLDIAVGRDKARAIGQLLTDKLNKAEATEILNTLNKKDPTLVGKLLKDKPLSRAESMRVMQIIKGSVTAGARPDLVTRAKIAREEIDALSQELLKLPIPEETKQIITNNLGTYVRRLYTTKEGKSILSKFFAGFKPLRLRGKRTFLRERAKAIKESFRQDILKEQNIISKDIKKLTIKRIKGIGGISETRLRRAGYGTIEALEKAKAEDLVKIFGIGETNANSLIAQAKVMSHTKRALQSRSGFLDFRLKKDITRVDFSAEVRRNLGEINEAGYPVTKTINGLVSDVETSKLFDFAATNPNLSTSDAKIAAQKGWVKLSDLASLGRLKNKFVPPEVADDIQYIQRIAGEAEKLYLKMLSLWKFGKVPLNPATHCRNLMSNAMLLDASGTPLTRQPALISMALEEMKTKGKFYQMAKKAGAFGGEFSEAEISSMLNNWTSTKGSGMERLIEFAGKKLKFENMSRLYQAEEQLFKLAKFIDMIGYQGATTKMAAAEAQKWLFNYNQIPSAVRTIRNSWWGSPFITFQYKVFPRMAESLIKNPIRLAKYPLLFEAMEQYAIDKYGLTDKEVALAKKRQPFNLNLPLSNFKYILPFKDENENIRVIDMGFTFPFGEVGEVGSFGNIMGFLNGPVPKIAPTITPLITGKPYTEPAFGRELKTTKEKIGYLAEQLLPPLVGYAGRKISAAAQKKTDYYGVPYDYWLEVMRNVFGVKTVAFIPELSKHKLNQQMEGMKRDTTMRINRIKKDRSLTPQEKQKKIQEEVDRYKKEMEGILKEFKLD